jgi:nanoRNase/pAp phosphatase (c-di-AMP/oligoRNAs hydrolase)
MRILWHYAKGKYKVSLFENGHDEVDCAKIAEKFGGGGHKGAAGFSCTAVTPIELLQTFDE